MATKLLKGIVIKEKPYGDSDKVVTILTKEEGLIQVYAKFARKPGKNMLVSTSVLSFCEFEISIIQNKGNFLNSASLIEDFSELKNDVFLLTYCSHILELVLDSMVDEVTSQEVYMLLLYSLYNFTKANSNPEFITHIFELRLLFIQGFMPILDQCLKCGKAAVNGSSKICFDCSGGGVICNKGVCRTESSKIHFISIPVLNCLLYISQSSIEKLFSFSISEKYSKELYELAADYLCEKYEKCYTKLDMLKDFNL